MEKFNTIEPALKSQFDVMNTKMTEIEEEVHDESSKTYKKNCAI